MLKSLLYVILGISEILTVTLLSIVYGGVCIFIGWLPDIPFEIWALITGFFSLTVLGLSFGLWYFTSYKESIHGWVLLPGIYVGKIWMYFSDNSFGAWLRGSILISLLFIILVLGEVIWTWYSLKSPRV